MPCLLTLYWCAGGVRVYVCAYVYVRTHIHAHVWISSCLARWYSNYSVWILFKLNYRVEIYCYSILNSYYAPTYYLYLTMITTGVVCVGVYVYVCRYVYTYLHTTHTHPHTHTPTHPHIHIDPLWLLPPLLLIPTTCDGRCLQILLEGTSRIWTYGFEPKPLPDSPKPSTPESEVWFWTPKPSTYRVNPLRTAPKGMFWPKTPTFAPKTRFFRKKHVFFNFRRVSKEKCWRRTPFFSLFSRFFHFFSLFSWFFWPPKCPKPCFPSKGISLGIWPLPGAPKIPPARKIVFIFA